MSLFLAGLYSGHNGNLSATSFQHNEGGIVATSFRTSLFATSAAQYKNPEADLKVVPLLEDSKTLEKRSQVKQAAFAAHGEVRKALAPKEKEIKIGKGDTISAVLQKAGLSGNETFGAITAMEDHLDPKKIKPGQSIYLRFDAQKDGDFHFAQMKIELDPVRSVIVEPTETGFSSSVAEKEVHVRTHAQKTKIETSLFGSALKAGIPSTIIAEAIRIYSWDVDFQRDIRQGDTIEILYESHVTEDGEFARYGNILYANLSVSGKPIPVYRYKMRSGEVDYFEPNGQSVRKALMKTPIDGARLSSGYGMRKHPVLGYNKLHKGQDFAAPSGTPIYAAGDGMIEKAGRWSSYGNYIRIRHNSDLKTAYAHMKGFAKGISSGKRVKQGEVIGYVGTTGRSTGPHLHYEVILKGDSVNPATVKLPQGKTLRVELEDFRKIMNNLQSQYDAMIGGMQLVKS
jgi:murein DD-endopeptidase MepM/ murein hydrolase activator NlpD